jgi:hypothetical protein
MAGTVARSWIHRTSRPRPWLIVGALFAVAAVLAGGYLLGASKAPDEHDAHAERVAAQRVAFKQGYAKGYDRGLSRGRTAGAAAGSRAGAPRGARDGQATARSTIKRALVAQSSRSLARPSPGGPASGSPLPGSGGVLVVGDSLEELTSPFLQKYLPSTQLTINAVGGYNSLQIYRLFQESYDPSQSVIVFDAGTNDNPAYPEILAGRLQAVAKQVGGRCMVVPTIHGLTVNGIASAGKNRVVRDFAASRPGTQTPDWANVVATHPELMQPDDLHPTVPPGADYRARLIARGVKACLEQRSSSGVGFGE